MTLIRHRVVPVEGRSVFVREAGDPARPGLVALQVYPTSGRRYVRLGRCNESPCHRSVPA